MSDKESKKEEGKYPDCGLYKTTTAFPGHEEQIPAGCLVSFHNHSEQGEPILLLPSKNTHNLWTFHGHGTLTQDQGYLSTLTPLLKEGFYQLKRHLHVGEKVLPEATLVQLGYNTKGEPILFVAKRVENTLMFPAKGVRFENEKIFVELDPVGFSIYHPDKKEPAQASEAKAKAKAKPTLH
jgi:hypothetical protein